ncbi:MAG: SIR2 family protein [Desulfonauticus sp.]|nr:SIR2 family protein [Desulfonauticus sp.]
MGTIKNSIEYVVKQLMDRNCTFVLGSGISNNAKGLEVYYNPHTINKMKINLNELEGTKKTLSCLSQDEIWKTNEELQKMVDKKNRTNNFRTETLKKYTQNKLIAKCCISYFCKLLPTKAHYFIAFIVREGLLSDIITTNYDCCMEKAYLDIWGKEYELGNGNNNLPVVRIFNNITFSRYASKKRFNDKEDSFILRVYKINGCAFAITQNESTSASILLTETQLQDWRKRQWAADFFRYKLRSSTLFFVGYGSDEPQVLHTMQKVFEENEENNDDVDNKPVDIYDMTNAPVVSVYEEKSFTHKYIVKQYCLHNGFSLDNSEKLIIDKNNGMVKTQFGVMKNLPADSLMELIYKEILKNLIKEALVYSSKPENASFTAFIPYAKKHLIFISDQKLDSLCDIDEKDNIPFPKIIKMLSYMSAKKFHYIPISHNKELVAELIFLLYILYGNFDFNIKQNRLGKFSILQTQENLNIYNFATKIFERRSISLDNNNFSVVFLIGKNNFKYSARRTLIQAQDNGEQYFSLYQINIKSIFTYYETINLNLQGDLNSIRRVIINAVRKPSKFIANERPSIKRKLKIYEEGVF